MNFFWWSNQSFNAASVLYALAFLFYSTTLVSDKKVYDLGSSWLARVGFLLHTAALILRWIEAGIHQPPWTNLYESLVFFSWGVMGAHLWLEWKHRFKLSGVFASAVVFAAMGIASLHPAKEIEPLVPALQSWWLHFHVFMACIAYAFFMASSFVSVFYLLKDGTSLNAMTGVAALVCTFFLAIAAGKSFFLTGEMQFFKLVTIEGREMIMNFKGAGGEKIQEFVKVPWLKFVLGPVLALYLAAGALLIGYERRKFSWVERHRGNLATWGRRLFVVATVAQLGMLIALFVVKAQSAELGLKSNPYRMAAMIMTLGLAVFFAALFRVKEKVIRKLPDLGSLDRWGYESILIGVPFMTINLISGAIWAYYAWGRYWGWDPKETWALITWFVYLIYLHMRILAGWKGRKTALISILGFFVVVFTYLGVNLVISGLHSYATS